MAYQKLTPIVTSGGTAPRYLGDRFADIVNVKDYGAVGDGQTDDTAAIKAAIVAIHHSNVSSGGPMLFFPFGVYLISEKLTIQWTQRVGIFLDGAIIRASAEIDCMLYLENNWMEDNVIYGGCWDMNHLASCGIQIVENNAGFKITDVTIRNVGDGIGLYLGQDTPVFPDGREHWVTNLKVTDYNTEEPYQSGSNLYDGIGLKITHCDCIFSNVIIGCCKTGILLTGGGHVFQNVHVWQRMYPTSTRWKDTIGIDDRVGHNSFDGLYLDNCGIGYKVADSQQQVSIGNLYWLKSSTTEGSTLSVPPIIFSVHHESYVSVNNLILFKYNLTNDSNICVFYNRSAATSNATDYERVNFGSRYRIVNHSIRTTNIFHVIDPAFECSDVQYMQTIGNGTGTNVSAGYYLIGFLAMSGSVACEFTLGTGFAAGTFTVCIYGESTFTITKQASLDAGGAATKLSICFGAKETDSLFGIRYFPVYVHLNNSNPAWTNLNVSFKPHSCFVTFYKVSGFALTSAHIMQASAPTVVAEKALANS